MRNKYTKAELVALVQVKLIGLGMKITQQDITKILNTYEHTIYEVLENGSPATLGCLGSFRFKTVAERFDDNSCVPPSPAYTGVKFRVNNDLKKSIREKTTEMKNELVKEPTWDNIIGKIEEIVRLKLLDKY